MTLLVFILVWVVLGAGLTFLALSRNPRGGRGAAASQSRTGRRVAFALFIASFVVFGAAIPFAITDDVEGRNSVDNSGIKLTADAERGRIIFGQRCRNCHALAAANASGRIGPNLDQILGADPFPEQLLRNALNNGKSEGQGQMPANIVEGEEEDQMVAFLKQSAGKVSPESNGSD